MLNKIISKFLPNYRPEGYSVCKNGVNTHKIVYWYDPEEYEAHHLVNSSEGEPDMTISSKWFRCDVCGGKFPIKLYYDTWDWGGPHCPNTECENGRMEMFGNTHPSVRNRKGVVLYEAEKGIELINRFIDRIRRISFF
jgi:hypothetical protein